MVARVFAPSHLTIDAGDRETLRQKGAEQKMIDAQTGIASKGVPKILPERVDPLARVQSPQRVGPALLHKAAICVPAARTTSPGTSTRPISDWQVNLKTKGA